MTQTTSASPPPPTVIARPSRELYAVPSYSILPTPSDACRLHCPRVTVARGVGLPPFSCVRDHCNVSVIRTFRPAFPFCTHLCLFFTAPPPSIPPTHSDARGMDARRVHQCDVQTTCASKQKQRVTSKMHFRTFFLCGAPSPFSCCAC